MLARKGFVLPTEYYLSSLCVWEKERVYDRWQMSKRRHTTPTVTELGHRHRCTKYKIMIIDTKV